jgi:hypothetical protein
MNSGINEAQNFNITQTKLDKIGIINKKILKIYIKKKSEIIMKIISKLMKNQKEKEKFIDKLVDFYGLKNH